MPRSRVARALAIATAALAIVAAPTRATAQVETTGSVFVDANGNGIGHTNNLRYSAGVVFHF